VQSVTFLKELYDLGVRGPFLIVAPLSTVPHWERTVLGWTDMNPVVFHGSATARGIIQNYEYQFHDPETRKKIVVKHPTHHQIQYKFDVMITTYEMALMASNLLKTLGTWRVIVVDEAHRLKNKTSKVSEILKSYSLEHRLLLTGTPLQNSLEELWSILNFLDPSSFPDGKISILDFVPYDTQNAIPRI
jgi:SNF2 family DNA or RNA helicase